MKTCKMLVLLPGLAILGAGAAPAQAKTLEAVASFTVLADVVAGVGGSRVHVTSLVPPGGDPHEFEPSAQDAKSLARADITFLSGEGLESWFARLVGASGYKGKPVIVSDGIKTREMQDDGKTVTDPHVWNSVPNVKIWVANIRQALAAADPEDAAAFAANAAAYTAKLDALDASVRAEMAAIPAARRKVLTSHDAFGYFGREYGVAFLAPLGVSTETEASAAGVAQLVSQIRAEGIKVYFFENSNDPRLVRQVAAATGAQPGGELYVEALSPPGGPAPDYISMMRSNADKLAAAMAK